MSKDTEYLNSTIIEFDPLAMYPCIHLLENTLFSSTCRAFTKIGHKDSIKQTSKITTFLESSNNIINQNLNLHVFKKQQEESLLTRKLIILHDYKNNLWGKIAKEVPASFSTHNRCCSPLSLTRPRRGSCWWRNSIGKDKKV